MTPEEEKAWREDLDKALDTLTVGVRPKGRNIDDPLDELLKDMNETQSRESKSIKKVKYLW